MSKVTCGVAISVDGYVAGPGQSEQNPLGEGGEELHHWHTEPEQLKRNAQEQYALLDAGAFIMGRNMFGPVRGEWDREWNGWWGDEPPYRAPVFVLTHHARPSVKMAGGTTFHFVTGGIDDALERARQAAGDRNVAIAGGASTVNQYLAAGHIDELRLHIVPVLLGAGERLFDGVSGVALEPVSRRGNELVTHVTYRVSTR